MKKMFLVLILALPLPAYTFELATKIVQAGDTTSLQTNGYAKVNLLKQSTSLTGTIVATGTLNVEGKANIVMWSKVDDGYYFSKLPGLQDVQNKKKLNFSIPFNAAEKTVTEVVINVEMLSKGSVSIRGLSVGNQYK